MKFFSKTTLVSIPGSASVYDMQVPFQTAFIYELNLMIIVLDEEHGASITYSPTIIEHPTSLPITEQMTGMSVHPVKKFVLLVVEIILRTVCKYVISSI